MTKEEVIEFLKENSSSFKSAFNDPKRKGYVDFRVENEMKYLNSEYGKKHLYPEIPIDEVT